MADPPNAEPQNTAGPVTAEEFHQGPAAPTVGMQQQLSPLSGAYLLIVVGEPFSEEHKKLILQKIQQGLCTWNNSANHVDIEQELSTISDCAPPGEEARGGERLIQFATENLVTEVLIHPQVNTLQQCMKNMLASFTKHRHIIHAGYTFAGKGSWILQDGTFSFEDFANALEEYDVQRVLRSYENSITIDVHCCDEGEWKQDKICQQPFAKLCQVAVNPNPLIKDSKSVEEFVSYIEPFLQPQSIQERLPPSDVVGNIRFSHPTLYVFPGGQGDSALFGINGFNMLIDGGFSRKACFWDFTRHLDRLDAILITRLSDENTQGINAVLERKSVSPVYPQIGHFFANILETKISQKEKHDEERDKLLVNVIHEGNSMIENLRILNLKPQICFRDNVCDPINLYHKVGHGKLDMYVLNPSKESQEVKEFLARWEEKNSHLGSFKSGINVDGKELWLPIANLVSICALLVWQPANPNDTITRLLFPGSTPQNKIFKGLEKLRKLECLKYPTCSSSSLKEVKTKVSSEKKRKMQKADNKSAQPDNSIFEKKEKKEKLAKKRQEKTKKEKEERERQEQEKREEKEKREKEKEELEKIEKERKEKERQDKLDRKRKSEEKKKEREKQEKEKLEQEKLEKKEKEAVARKEKDDKIKKEVAAKKEKEEKEEKLKKEASKKEKESEQSTVEVKTVDKSIKKKTVEKESEQSTVDVKTVDKSIKKKTVIKTKPKKNDVKNEVNDSVSSTRKVMPVKPTGPSIKLKKEENNKRVVENRKAAVAAKNLKKIPDNDEKTKIKKKVTKPKNEKEKLTEKTSGEKESQINVNEKNVSEKVSEAIASGEIDNSRVVKDDEEDKESVIEKDQIEEMETSPVEDKCPDHEFEKDIDDDEEDVELQRIKDDDDDDNQAPVPDIGGKLLEGQKGEDKIDNLCKPAPEDLRIERDVGKIAYSHVKTPDEVDDLPEHEVVVPDENSTEENNSDIPCNDVEEKIALDENEKEVITKAQDDKDNSEGSIEAVRSNEIVEVVVEQKMTLTPEGAKDICLTLKPSKVEEKDKINKENEEKEKDTSPNNENEYKDNQNEASVVPHKQYANNQEKEQYEQEEYKQNKKDKEQILKEDKHVEELPAHMLSKTHSVSKPQDDKEENEQYKEISNDDLKPKQPKEIPLAGDMKEKELTKPTVGENKLFDSGENKNNTYEVIQPTTEKGGKTTDIISNNEEKDNYQEQFIKQESIVVMGSNSKDEVISGDLDKSIIPGNLEIVIHEARYLEKKDLVGKSDPYVTISLGDKIYRSKTLNNDSSPKWGFKSNISMDESSPNQIIVNVMDDDYGKDDHLGSTTLYIQDFVNQQYLKETWIPLKSCKTGEVLVSGIFSPVSLAKEFSGDVASEIESNIFPSDKVMNLESSNLDKQKPTAKKSETFTEAKDTTSIVKDDVEVKKSYNKDDSQFDTKNQTKDAENILEQPEKNIHELAGQSMDIMVDTLDTETFLQEEESLKKDHHKEEKEDSHQNINIVHSEEKGIYDNKDHEKSQEIIDSQKKGNNTNKSDNIKKETETDHQKQNNEKKDSNRFLESKEDISEVDNNVGDDTLSAVQSKDPVSNLNDFKKAEKIVEDIVNKAEKVMDQVQGNLDSSIQDITDTTSKSDTEDINNKKENNEVSITEKTADNEKSEDKDLEFKQISKESQGIVEKLEESFKSKGGEEVNSGKIKNKPDEEEQKKSSDIFKEIEKESKVIVNKLEESIITEDTGFNEDNTLETNPPSESVAIDKSSNELDSQDIHNYEIKSKEKMSEKDKPDALEKTTITSSKEPINIKHQKDGSEDAFEFSEKNEKDDIVKETTSDSFINEIYESMGKQISSQHDEELSSEEEGKRKKADFEPGVLMVKVHGASDLEKKDLVGKSDPYTKIKFGDQVFNTETIKNTLQPKWHFSTELKIDNTNEKVINFEVYDKDLGKDSFAGSYSLSLDRAINESVESKWFDLEGCKSGKIQISTSFEKSSDNIGNIDNNETMSDNNLSTKMQITNGENVKTSDSNISPRPGHLTISVHKARNLEKKGILGKSDPYIQIYFGENSKYSNIVKNNLDPVWNYEATFVVDQSSPEHLTIEILDDDLGKDDKLGMVSVKIHDLQDSNIENKWLSLEKCKSGEILISSKFTSEIEVRTESKMNVLQSLEYNTEVGKIDMLSASKEDINNKTLKAVSENKGTIMEEIGNRSEKSNEIVSKDIPVAQYHDSSLLDKQNLKIVIHKARNLEKKGLLGKADPYIKVSVGDHVEKSSSVKNNLDPVWEYEALFSIDDNSPEYMTIEVFDDDLGKDDKLGVASVKIKDIKDSDFVNEWIMLEESKSGEILISSSFTSHNKNMTGDMNRNDETPEKEDKSFDEKGKASRGSVSEKPGTQSTDFDSSSITAIDQDMKSNNKPNENELTEKTNDTFDTPLLQSGIFKISVHRAKNLEKKGLFGKADPYVQICIGDKVEKSKSIKNSLDPVWEYETTFVVDKSSPKYITIEVYDDDLGKDDKLGLAYVNLHEMQNCDIVNKWIPLEMNKSGEILLSTKFTSAFESENEGQNNTPKPLENITESGKQDKIFSTNKDKIPLAGESVGRKTPTDEVKSNNEKSNKIVSNEKTDCITLTKPVDSSSLEPGLLSVSVHKARNLEKTGILGKADPYVQLSIGDLIKKSSSVKNNLDPVWDYKTSFIIDSKSSEYLTIEVNDDDIGKDDKLGVALVKIMDIQHSDIMNKWIPLEKCKTGEILISSSFTFKKNYGPEDINYKQESKEEKEKTFINKDIKTTINEIGENNDKSMETVLTEKTDAISETTSIKSGQLLISVHKAKNLEKKGLFGKADPYIQLCIGDQIQKSESVKNSLDPVWEYEAEFVVDNNSPDYLNIEAFDDDMGKDDKLGNTSIKIKDLQDSDTSSKWIPLSQCKSGEILLSSRFVSEDKNDNTKFDVEEEINLTKDQNKLEAEPTLNKEKILTAYDSTNNKHYPSNDGIDPLMKKSEEFPSTETTDDTYLHKHTDSASLQSGQIQVLVHKARNLENKGVLGKIDPYIKLSIGDQTMKSTSVKNDSDPIWEYEASFIIDKISPEHLTLEVFDDDFGKDDKLGAVFVKIQDMQNKDFAKQWIPLEMCKSGEILISSTFISDLKGHTGDEGNKIKSQLEEDRNVKEDKKNSETSQIKKEEKDSAYIESHPGKKESIIDEIANKSNKSDGIASPEKTDDISVPETIDRTSYRAGNITILVHKARNIEKRGLLGKADPYVLLSVGDQNRKSNTIKNDLDPVWEYEASFVVDNKYPEYLTIEVFDDDVGNDDKLGVASVKIKDIQDSDIVHKWIPLEKCKSGEILLSSTFTLKLEEDIESEMNDKIFTDIQHTNQKSTSIQSDTGKILAPIMDTNESTEIASTQDLKHSIIDKSDKVSLLENDGSYLPKSGRLTVFVHKARELEKKGFFGKADPFIQLSFGEVKRSDTVKSSLDPVWNYEVSFIVDKSSPEYLKIEVFDEDSGKDDSLGIKSIKTIDMQENNMINKWIPLEKCKSGDVLISSTFTFNSEEGSEDQYNKMDTLLEQGRNVDEKNVTLLVDSSDKQENKTYSEIESETEKLSSALDALPIEGQLTVFVHKARNLQKKGLFGKADPYIQLSIGKQISTSTSIKNNLNPAWDYQSSFVVDKNSPDDLIIKILDDDIGKDDNLGEVSIKIKNMQTSDFVNDWIPLEKCKSGEILLSSKFIKQSKDKNYKQKYSKDEQEPSSLDMSLPLSVDSTTCEIEKNNKTDYISGENMSLAKDDNQITSHPIEPISDTKKGMITEKTTHERKMSSVSDKMFGEIEESSKTHDKSEPENTISNVENIENISNQKETFGDVSKNIVDEKCIDGNIDITIHEGRNLEKKDLLGKSDPYVIVKYGDKTFISQAIKDNLNPKWEFKSGFQIDNSVPYEVLVEVKDEDTGKDDKLGSITLNILDIIEDKNCRKEWTLLQNCKTGEILVSITFTPSKEESELQIKVINGDFSPEMENEPSDSKSKSGKSKPKNQAEEDGKKDKQAPTETNGSASQENDEIPEEEYESFIAQGGFKFSAKGRVKKVEKDTKSMPFDTTENNSHEFGDYNEEKNPANETMIICKRSEDDEKETKIIEHNSIYEAKKENLLKTNISESLKEIHNEEQQTLINQIEDEKTLESNIKSGVMKVTVHKANKLENHDILGKSDPFVKIIFADKEYKSLTIKNTLEPEWNYSADLKINEGKNDNISIKIFDDDFGKNDFQGHVIISVKEAMKIDDKLGTWFDLVDAKSGKVLISTKFIPDVTEEPITITSSFNLESQIEHSVKTPSQEFTMKKGISSEDNSNVNTIKDIGSIEQLINSEVENNLPSISDNSFSTSTGLHLKGTDIEEKIYEKRAHTGHENKVKEEDKSTILGDLTISSIVAEAVLEEKNILEKTLSLPSNMNSESKSKQDDKIESFKDKNEKYIKKSVSDGTVYDPVQKENSSGTNGIQTTSWLDLDSSPEDSELKIEDKLSSHAVENKNEKETKKNLSGKEGENDKENKASEGYKPKYSTQKTVNYVFTEGSIGIESIINNLFSVLGDLSKSVGDQKSIISLKDNLDCCKKTSEKIITVANDDNPSTDNESELGKNLRSLVVDVERCVQKTKSLGPEKHDECDQMLTNCKDILKTLDFQGNLSKTPPPSPSDVKLTNDDSATFTPSVSLMKVNGKLQEDCVDGSSFSRMEKENESNPLGTSFLTHQVKSFETRKTADNDGSDSKRDETNISETVKPPYGSVKGTSPSILNSSLNAKPNTLPEQDKATELKFSSISVDDVQMGQSLNNKEDKLIEENTTQHIDSDINIKHETLTSKLGSEHKLPKDEGPNDAKENASFSNEKIQNLTSMDGRENHTSTTSDNSTVIHTVTTTESKSVAKDTTAEAETVTTISESKEAVMTTVTSRDNIVHSSETAKFEQIIQNIDTNSTHSDENIKDNMNTDSLATAVKDKNVKIDRDQDNQQICAKSNESIHENTQNPEDTTNDHHFQTPPVLTLDEREIQACAIGIGASTRLGDDVSQASKDSLKSDIEKSELDTKSVPLSLGSAQESKSSSSDYKMVDGASFNSKSDPNNEKSPIISQDNIVRSDLLVVDSGTDDQMSSGTFSQDDSSPRYADLPSQLTTEKNRKISEPVIPTDHQEMRKALKDRSLSMETRSTSINSEASDQEIPPTTPRSDLNSSPTSEGITKFTYAENVEKASMDNVDIMTQSIYVGSETNDYDAEMSSESHQSTVQTLERKISSTIDDTKITTTVEEKSSIYESVIKLSENVTENILEETKIITKSTKMAVEDSILKDKKEVEIMNENSSNESTGLPTDKKSEFKGTSEELNLNEDDFKIKEGIKDKLMQETGKETKEAIKSDETKKGTKSYSDVLKSSYSVDEDNSNKHHSIGKEAASEVLKSDNVLELVYSKEGSSLREKKPSYSDILKSDKSNDKTKDPIADWGKPLGLPSPVRPSTPSKPMKKENKEQKEDEQVDSNKVKEAFEPVWMDLAYVPHHGASNYADTDFFKRVRARYYVFSGVEPSKEVFNALLEAKKTWENKEQEVTIIPTYDTDVLGYWVAENEELLTELKIDLAPSASRCTINLQDHATSCAAYRLEF